MSRIVFVLTLVVILGLCYLALENPTGVQLKLFRKTFEDVPLYMVVFGAFLLGAVFVYILFLLQGLRGLVPRMRERRIRRRDEKTEGYRQEARERLQFGALDKSKTLLEKAIQLTPDNLELSLDLADVLLEAKQYTEASDRYHHVFSRDPQNPRAILGIARSNEGSENHAEAELYYSRILGTDKSNPVALQGLLRSQKGQQRWHDAMKTLRAVHKEGLVSGEEFDERLAGLWYAQAMAEEKDGNSKASIASLERSLKVKHDFLPSLLSLGEVYIREGTPDRATRLWEGALMERLHPPLVKALESYMVEHNQERDLIQFYKRTSSRNDKARLLLARVYLKQNLIDDAEAEIKKMGDAETSPSAMLIMAEVEKKRLNEALSNRHYSLATELLQHQLEKYRCSVCGTLHDRWQAQCEACSASNALQAGYFLP